MPPPEDASKGQNHKIYPQDHHPLCQRDVDVAFASFPIVTDLEEFLWVVRDDAVEAFADAPPHHVFFVDSPCEDGPTLVLRISYKAFSEIGNKESFLQHVEGDVRDREKLSRVGD